MIKSSIKYSLFFVLLGVLIFSSCAKRGIITGGLKDSLAPVLVKAYPENFSTGFKNNKIEIEFNELIKIKDINSQLIISPPLKYKPIVEPQSAASKKITITIKDTLKENTTYSFNFGQSITDNNEGNPYNQFKYVVSTGTYIDSLSLVGQIKDAFNQKSDNFVSIHLYDAETFTDSTIYKEQPLYVTNTLDSLTYFGLENLRKGNYKIIALKDKNNNGKYDPKSDKIGFLKETIHVPSDTLYQLELFKENGTVKASALTQESKNKWFLGYEGDKTNLKISANTNNINIPLKILPYSDTKKDSIQLFLPILTAEDSIVFKIENRLFKKEYSRKIKDLKTIDSLQIDAIKPKYNNFNDAFEMYATTPIKSIDVSKISIIDKDSLMINFNHKLDTLKNSLSILFEKKETEKYSILVEPNAFVDYNNTTNDSLNFKINTRKFNDYGNLTVVPLNGSNFPYILEVIKDKDIVVATAIITENKAITFNLIEPNAYTLRIIEDENKNNVWDTGNYQLKKQAERVIYFPKPVDIRANWDVEQIFDIR